MLFGSRAEIRTTLDCEFGFRLGEKVNLILVPSRTTKFKKEPFTSRNYQFRSVFVDYQSVGTQENVDSDSDSGPPQTGEFRIGAIKKRLKSIKKQLHLSLSVPTRYQFDYLIRAREILPEALNFHMGVADIQSTPHPCDTSCFDNFFSSSGAMKSRSRLFV